VSISGTFRKKIPRHETRSVRTPPISGETAARIAAINP
jgi:hypothetical protein